MSFWGIEVKPGKPYKYYLPDEDWTVYLTQATLGHGSSKEKCVLQCSSRDRSPVYLCSLLPDQTECCPLSLEFEETDDIVFSVIGSRSIHLSGKFLPDEGHSDEERSDSDSFGEDIVDTETDDSSDYDSNDEYEGDFIDDDDTSLPPSLIPNSGVIIEEIVDDDEPTSGNCKSDRIKKKKKKQISDSEENKNSESQVAVKSSTVLESEDKDGLPNCSSNNNDVTIQKSTAETEQIDRRTTEKIKKKKANDLEHATSVKRKVDDVDQDHQPESDVREPKKKQKKQQKKRSEEEKADETGDQPEDLKRQNLSQVSSAGNELDQKPVEGNELHSEEKKKRNKKKKKKKTEGGDLTSKETTVSDICDKGVSSMQVEEHNEPKSSQARTFGNGLVIEELTMGKPDGKRASPGRLVSVHYTGKLKLNGEIFDSNVGASPFKFRHSVGAVIKGWDVGVNGMRIGDKRRLTIPPTMGYGSEGAGEKIPPDSWLVFDVELVDVR